ncbi:3697_t:CDS:2, partial [Cetraspora pellucida]
IFPYQWLTSKNKFKEMQPPPRKDFNSNLDRVNYCEQGCESKECEHEKIYTITQKDYDFAHTVWKETACKTFSDYYDIYLKTDVLILADAFEAFQKASYSAFKLDSANYLTTPGDMHDFFIAMKREGISLARRRIARANIPGLEGYDRKKTKKWLLYLDANNLYGWAMSQYLPTGGFKWLSTISLEASHPLVQKILKIKENSNRECCLEVKLSIPKELHPKFRDYPMYTEKLILTLHDKDHYVIHYRNLQQCIKEEYVLEKNAFEKNFWKLMNNSVFGKTMEDVRKRVNIDLVRQVDEEQRLHRLISDPAFVSRKIFYGANLVTVHRRQTNVKLNKPEYVGVCILDLSKYFMYDFWYGHLKKKYGDRVKLLYTDTDSLIIEIETENIYQDMIDDCDLFDFSDYPEDHWIVKNLLEDQ